MSIADLNPPQRQAVRTRSGPLLVLAGAGTGKTRVITYRIAELVRQGVDPERILAVTFTNKAAREMQQRALALLRGPSKRLRGGKPEISTFHSLCVRVLRRHIRVLGYPSDFPIYDQGDQESLARSALREVRVGSDKLRPGELLSMISGWKSRSLRPDAALERAVTDKQQLAAMAYARYQVGLRAAGAVDFDDLLLCTEELFLRVPEARKAEAARYDHLLIDEYQDTNALQYRIVRMLAEGHRNLCVVGDDDQAIYGWRGAEVQHILGFANDWPGAKVVRLEDNYRCQQPILDLANTLIVHNTQRHHKVLRASRLGGAPPRFIRFEDEVAEATELVRELHGRLSAEGTDRLRPGDIAILFRTNEQPRAFEVELRRARIPYVLVGGMSFYDRKEVRDLLAYLKVLAHPRDEVSLLRIINTPRRGIGPGAVQALLDRAVAAGLSLWEVVPAALEDGVVPPAAAQQISAFRAMIERYRGRLAATPLAVLTQELLEEVGYKAELERLYKTPAEVEARWLTLSELTSAIATYEEREESPTLAGFLEQTTLAGREDKRDDDDDQRRHAVTLMTLHSAKGLEFPHVYLVGMEEGLLPHRRSVADSGMNAIAEERRLCYVGVTRAKDVLTLSFCKERMKWGKRRPSIPSRFLLEMRGETEKAARVAEAAKALFATEPAEPEDDDDSSSDGATPRHGAKDAKARGGKGRAKGRGAGNARAGARGAASPLESARAPRKSRGSSSPHRPTPAVARPARGAGAGASSSADRRALTVARPARSAGAGASTSAAAPGVGAPSTDGIGRTRRQSTAREG